MTQTTLSEVRKDFDQFWVWMPTDEKWVCGMAHHHLYFKAGDGRGHLLYSIFDGVPAIVIPEPTEKPNV
jgi:hypothetical protein